MVRVNLIKPRYLTDQHLIAEYAEILMLLKYIRNYPSIEDVPKEYCLSTGHQTFFKNKVLYLKKRHDLLRKEMLRRGFKPRIKASLRGFKKKNLHDWRPHKKDYIVIKKRLIARIRKQPNFYRYYRRHKSLKEMVILAKKAN